MDKTLECSSVSGQLAALLQRQMVQGDIRPGAKLASQRAMQQQFQLSRASVREAMAELQNVGLVETHHGGGSFCCNLLDPFFQNDSGDLPGPGHSLPVQVLEMREVLEGEAAYYCALRASDAERQLIAREYEQMSARAALETSLSPAKTLRQAKADLTFHMLIADNCHHLLVLSISQILYSRYFNAIYSVLSQTFKKQGSYPQQIGTQHRDICQAICRGDAEAARTEARQHIAYTRGLLLS
ncbi:MAG: FCD domain-containing protein [Motiliproteus sp.]